METGTKLEKSWKGLTHMSRPTSLEVGDLIIFRTTDGVVSFEKREGGRTCFPNGDDRFFAKLHPRRISDKETLSIARLIGMIIGCGIEKVRTDSPDYHIFRFIP